LSYETIILKKLENLKQFCFDLNKEEANVFVRCDPFFSMVADDGYNEIDFLFSLIIEPNIERKIVLMLTKVVDGERVFIREIDDEDAWKRARKYCARLGKDNYYGLSNGSKVTVRSLDPATRFESTVKFEEIAFLLRDIISEERRIKDSEEFTRRLRDYFSELQPYVHSSLTALLKDKEFRKSLARFLEPIGMAPEDEELLPETVSMISQQATYLLLDKTLFLALLNESKDQLLPKLLERGDKDYTEVFKQLSEPLPEISGEDPKEWATRFWDALEEKFKLIRLINYEPIFDPEASPLNEVSLRGDPGGCLVLKDILAFLYGKERLAKLFDGPLLSRIYEGLIPPELRWKWGQIYTPPEVTRLIAEWGIRSAEDRVLDPACGTGRFLVSAYNKLRELKRVQGKEPTHQELLNQIYGIDINQFPAHLATMSLVALDLTSVTDEVNIRVSDFFHYQNYMQAKIGGEEERRIRVVREARMERKGLEGQARFPVGENSNLLGPFNAVLMNPPYTRQEALGSYKNKVRKVALEIARKGMTSIKVPMSKRAGYYVYFITHGTNFLKENGRFGMIIQNSWLDVDYGRDVQKFLLENYKIVAVIDCSKERFIKTADVNTVIVFLEKCMGKEVAEERDSNLTHFVDLKKSLDWFESNYGFKELIELIESTKEDYGDDDLRIIVKAQKELWEEGLEEVEQEDGTKKLVYSGSKWGKYLRAPDIYFEILKKGKDLLVPLKEIAKVRRGFTTGANEFFYLPSKHFDTYEDGEELVLLDKKTGEEKFRIEKEFWMHKEQGGCVPNYVIKSPRECKSIIIDPKDLKYRVLMIHKGKDKLKGTNILKYIKWGEKEGFHKGSTCASRSNWYDLGKKEFSRIIFPRTINDGYIVFLSESNVYASDRFYQIFTRKDFLGLSFYLISTLFAFFSEVTAKHQLGLGALDLNIFEFVKIPVLNLTKIPSALFEKMQQAFRKLSERNCGSVFEEIGANNPEDVSLDKVKSDRRELDEIIMGDILGLSKREQLEVYRGLLRLVKDRLEKAQTGD
jgi:tRNA1(Val) A37 N6-methylase TrmN6